MPKLRVKRLLPALVLLAAAHAFAFASAAQDADTAWERMSKFDYSKQLVTREQLKDLLLDDLGRIRGIIFGRHGRVFKDRDIKSYLSEQPWFKPNPNFSNSLLNETERANLDLVREMEAKLHETIQPGDLRWWQARAFNAEQLGEHTAAEWRILRAEVEAIHGRRFDDQPWLQQYFDDRYWYKADPAYDSKRLSAVERRNLTTLDAAQRKQRRLAISPGDMEHFQTTEINEKMLEGLSLHELRLLRNEVYALHGRQFRTEWLAQHFWSQPWYLARDEEGEPELSAVEKKNIETIVAFEKRLKDGLSTKPLPKGLLEGMFLEDARKL
ncbi:MAG TPA: YARHG domain-containing protein, partial [Pyrinomonadaceae bacterium]|nr:YARHG domain-containing protein [Pyrinomonadaceae bacterium]